MLGMSGVIEPGFGGTSTPSAADKTPTVSKLPREICSLEQRQKLRESCDPFLWAFVLWQQARPRTSNAALRSHGRENHGHWVQMPVLRWDRPLCCRI